MPCVGVVHFCETGRLPGGLVALNDERAGRLVEFVGVGRKHAGVVFAEGQGQPVKKAMSAKPDVTVRTDIELRLKLFCVLFSGRAVDSVCSNTEVATFA